MSLYKQMYLTLFHAMTDAIEILQQGQIAVEELYMNGGDEEGADDLDEDGANT